MIRKRERERNKAGRHLVGGTTRDSEGDQGPKWLRIEAKKNRQLGGSISEFDKGTEVKRAPGVTRIVLSAK